MVKKIGVDIRLYYNKRGISSYIFNFLSSIEKTSNKSSEQIVLFTDRTIPKEIKKLGYRYVILPIKIYPLWDLLIPFILKYQKIDTFHSMGNSSPLIKFSNISYYTTIHDLIFFQKEFKGNSVRQIVGRFYWKLNIKLTLKKIDKILTVSNSTKTEIIKELKVKPDKIIILYQGCNPLYSLNEKPPFENLKYFMSFGSLDKRKNTIRTIRAFDLFCRSNDYKLKIIGITQMDLKLLDKNLEIKHPERFEFLKNLSSKEILNSYRNALGLIYVSLSEGFGIPIIESNNCLTPVITSNYGATKEIASNSAILVNPKSIEEIVRALHLLNNKETYKQFQKLGLKNSNRFKWDSLANQLLQIYE